MPKVLTLTLEGLRLVSCGLSPLRILSLWKVSTLTGAGVGVAAAGAAAAIEQRTINACCNVAERSDNATKRQRICCFICKAKGLPLFERQIFSQRQWEAQISHLAACRNFCLICAPAARSGVNLNPVEPKKRAPQLPKSVWRARLTKGIRSSRSRHGVDRPPSKGPSSDPKPPIAPVAPGAPGAPYGEPAAAFGYPACG